MFAGDESPQLAGGARQGVVPRVGMGLEEEEEVEDLGVVFGVIHRTLETHHGNRGSERGGVG